MPLLLVAILAAASSLIGSSAAADASARSFGPRPSGVATATVPQHKRAALVGKLGYEGGPYPGGFHPTSGWVEVEFQSHPLVLLKHVGRSGRFRIPLAAGTYTVIGCGPGGPEHALCGKPRTIKLRPGEIKHIRLVWALTP